MNAQLLDDGFELPDMGMIPQGGKGNWSINLSTLHPSLTGTIDITNKRCEAVYDEILKHLQSKTSQKVQTPGGRSGDGQGEGEGGTQPGGLRGDIRRSTGQGSTQSTNDKEVTQLDSKAGESEEANQQGNQRSSSPGGWDIHIRGNGEKSNNNNPQETTNTANEITNKLKRMAEDLKRNGIDMSKYYEPEEQPVHNWKEILKEYLDKASTVRDILTPKKFNLTFGHWKADKRAVEGDLIRAVIAIDTSGSIGQKEFNEVLSELQSLCVTIKNLELRILLWHTDVYQDVVVSGESEEVFDNIKQIRLQSGGTTISSVAGVLNKNKEIEYSIIVYFTDGIVESSPVFSSDTDSIIILTKGTGDGVVPVLEKALSEYRSYSDQRVYKTDL
jgi:predicted metal-dependent peptidase